MLLGTKVFSLGRNAPSLPYDSEVEYLDSNDTNPYIELGVSYLDHPRDFDLKYMLRNPKPTAESLWDVDATPPFGWRYGPGIRYGIWKPSANSTVFRTGSAQKTGGYYELDIDGAVHEISMRCGQNTITIDGTELELPYVDVPNHQYMGRLCIFANTLGKSFDGNEAYPCNARIWFFRIFNIDDNPLLDLKPVRFTNENGENEGAMWDSVSQTFFRAAQGRFSIGPDKT